MKRSTRRLLIKGLPKATVRHRRGPWRREQCPPRLVDIDSQGCWRIANVRWGLQADQHWAPVFAEITVRPASLRNVYLTVEPFQPTWLAAHAVLVFEFDTPVSTEDGRQDNCLVLSIEARRRRRQRYGMVQGMLGRYAALYLLSSWSDLVDRACRKEGHTLMRYRLTLTQEQQQALLDLTLRTALEPHRGEAYNTVTNSCITATLKLLNEVVPPRQRVRTPLPGLLPKLLAAHGLIDQTPVLY